MNLKELNLMNSLELYEYFLPTIKEILSNYTFVALSDKDFSSIMKSLYNYVKKYNNKKLTNSRIKHYLESLISAIVAKKFESKERDSLINNYILLNIKNPKNHKEALVCLRKISNLFTRLNFFPDPYVLIDIIRASESLKEIIRQVVGGVDTKIENDFEDLKNDPNILSLIESYCELENISLKKEAYEQENDDLDDALGLYFKDMSSRENQKLLTRSEEIELAKRTKEGDEEAKRILIESNLSLVVSIAKRYITSGLPFEDLIQEGNIGLMKGADKFDYTKGCKFGTYATWWIRQSITKAITDKSKEIRLPDHMVDKIYNLKCAEDTLLMHLNREATNKELAEELDWSVQKVIEVKKIRGMETINLSMIVKEEEEQNDTKIEDVIFASEQSTEDEAIDNYFKMEMANLMQLAPLTDREIRVLQLFYGIGEQKTYKLAEIGVIVDGLSRERVRQLRESGLKKLRDALGVDSFAIYLNNPDAGLKNLLQYRKENTSRKMKKYCQIHSFAEFFPTYKQYELEDAVNSLPSDEKRIVFEIFGEDLSKCISVDKEFNIYFLTNILPKIKVFLRTKRKGTKNNEDKHSIYKLFQVYTKEEIDSVLKTLMPSELNCVNMMYDEHMPCSKNVSNQFYINIVPKIRKALIDKYGPRNKVIQLNYKTVYEFFNKHTKEEIDESISVLPIDIRSIIYLRHGGELENPIATNLTKEEENKYNYFALPRLDILLNKKANYEIVSIYKYYPNYTHEQIDYVIESLGLKEKELIYLRHGGDPENPILTEGWNDKKAIQYYTILIPKIDYLLEKEFTKPKVNRKNVRQLKYNSIYEYFKEYTKEDVDEAIAALPEELRKLIDLRYNSDDSKYWEYDRYKAFYTKVIPRIRRYLARKYKNKKASEEEKLTKDDYNYISKFLSREEFRNMTDIGMQESMIIALRYRYINGKCFSTKCIAEFLGLDEELVVKTERESLKKYKGIIQRFEENSDFSSEDDGIAMVMS